MRSSVAFPGVCLDDARDDVALDELALLARGLAKGGGGEPVVCQKSGGGKRDASRSVVVARRMPIAIAGPGYHGGARGTEAVRFLVVWMAGWVNSHQLEVIEFLREENRVLREQIGGRRLRFTDDQRRRLAVKGRVVGHRGLGEFAGLVAPAGPAGMIRLSHGIVIELDGASPSWIAALARELARSAS